MQQRDLVINSIFVVLIGVVTYFLVSFKEADLTNPDWLANAGAQTVTTSAETPFSVATPKRLPKELAFVRYDPMRTIIKTPTPPPRTPTPTPAPPPVEQVMSQFQLVMPDPPGSAMLQDKRANEMTTWKVNETRAIQHPKGSLDVTLVKVDSNDFSVHFKDEYDREFVMKLF